MAGNGTLRERAPNVWTLRVELGRPAGAPRKWQTATHKGTERDARRALSKLLAEVEYRAVANPTPPGVLTFADLFDRWIEAPTPSGRRRAATTTYQERSRFERHVVPVFGDRAVEGVTKAEVRGFYQLLQTTPRPPRDRPLSSTSVARIHETLKAMCTWAEGEALIVDSPMRGVRKPSVPQNLPKAPTSTEVQSLLAFLKSNDRPMWCAARLAATTGLRRSELVALTWRSFDWDKGTVTVDRGLVAIPGAKAGEDGTASKQPSQRVATDTKTGLDGSAVLYLDEELIEALHAWRMETMESSGKVQLGYLFTSDMEGKVAWHPDTLTARLRKSSQQTYNTRDITLKQLRAYVATELASTGTDLATAQYVLRHKSPLTTMRHYTAARKGKAHQSTRGLGDRLAKGLVESDIPSWRATPEESASDAAS